MTLMETLAATLLFALLAVGLASVLAQSLDAFGRTKATALEQRSLQAALARMEHDFASAVGRSPATPLAFVGTSDSVEFVSLIGDDEFPYTFVRYEWELRDRDSEEAPGAWVRRSVLFDPAASSSGSNFGSRSRFTRSSPLAGELGPAAELLRGSRMVIEYFDSGRGVWLASWNSEERQALPGAVRLLLFTGDDEAREFVFRLFAERLYAGESNE